MNRKVIVTGDNSKTLLIPDLNETYHSTNGALNEAQHVFIQEGLAQLKKQDAPISIFEMGFGTGLNALVTLAHCLKHKITVHYTALEKYPLSWEESQQMDYASLFNRTEYSSIIKQMHTCKWEETVDIHPLFKLKKLKGDIHTVSIAINPVDLIYFDAFGPRVQADLWTITVLKKMNALLKHNGMLTTYCAQGQFKRNLKAAGFAVKACQDRLAKER